MRLDPYLVGFLRGDGSVSKRKDGAYAVWADQAEKNRRIIEEVRLRFERLGRKVFFYRYYSRLLPTESLSTTRTRFFSGRYNASLTSLESSTHTSTNSASSMVFRFIDEGVSRA